MLSGRLAVVTGGGGGIGSAVCRILAREGARVTISDLHLDECNKTLEVRLQCSTVHSVSLCEVSTMHSTWKESIIPQQFLM